MLIKIESVEVNGKMIHLIGIKYSLIGVFGRKGDYFL